MSGLLTGFHILDFWHRTIKKDKSVEYCVKKF